MCLCVLFEDLSYRYSTGNLTRYFLLLFYIKSAIESSRVVSMTAPPPTNAQGLDTSKVQITEEDFLHLIDTEMVKVETFTLQQVTKIRDKIQSVETVLRSKVDRVTGGFYGIS
jgi:hypothetical protein